MSYKMATMGWNSETLHVVAEVLFNFSSHFQCVIKNVIVLNQPIPNNEDSKKKKKLLMSLSGIRRPFMPPDFKVATAATNKRIFQKLMWKTIFKYIISMNVIFTIKSISINIMY